ncbi:hypothetical protein OG311_00695 [Streptomyces sp. NBC_01343]|uniref:hypothetical protein n=1 Tax=Streptomyces sp. NBC_01343 TaxID=2903832 RepID=UPI002E13396C|nr:hypothetical protein OG311_00695 [Streptomyces sp. NBC_01343]
MLRFWYFLSRFRPRGTPGPAVTGVPADREAELAAELDPLLAGLAGVQAEAAEIRAEAAREAEGIRHRAAVRAAEIVAAAETGARQARELAAAPARRAARAEATQIVASGVRAAAALRRRADARLPVLADRVVDDAFSEPSDVGRGRWAPGGSRE